ncbi:hypothetical protein HKX48_001860 [Thoreauomyces humboldtii]|nr:hypothetical protein HKX48_001860 [Thoreauomyces humboldtii]
MWGPPTSPSSRFGTGNVRALITVAVVVFCVACVRAAPAALVDLAANETLPIRAEGAPDVDSPDYLPRFHNLMRWSDFIIGVSYFGIPIQLAFFAFKLPSLTLYQKSVAALLVTFIALCGFGHLLESREVGWRLVLANRILTAVVSAITAAAMAHVLNNAVKAVIRSSEEGKLIETQHDMLADAQALTHLGSWEMEFLGVDGSEATIEPSQEWLRIFGMHLDTKRVSFERYLNCVAEDERNAIIDAVRDASITGECFNFVQRIHRETDNRELYLRVFGKPLDSAGRARLRGTAQDITTQVHAERELVRAKEAALIESKHKDIFLSTISHELRTPLTSIIGHVDLMEETNMDDLQKEYMSSAKRAASTLLSVINDILDYSKLMAGMVDMDPYVVHLDEVLTDIHAITKDLGNNIHLIVRPYRGPHLVIDAIRLRQILLNLVSNAVKFTPAGGLVEVTNAYNITQDGQAEVTLAVRDTGIGISAPVIARLFQPFMQADATTSRRFGGTGLGLSIVKKLITAMGGSIHISSEEGVGSIFTVKLTAPTAAPPPSALSPVPVSTELRILVAEDNIVTQKLLTRMLRPCDVTICENGQVAVNAVRNADVHFEIMLCDVNMPVMDGLTATRQIRELAAGRNIYIIGLTANGFKKDREDCLNAGMDAYLSKPFT